jgi:2-dehydropantoate 2-reductase
VHGNITEWAHEVCRLVSYADSAKVTDNLWGERWSKLVANTMANGVSACTGLPGSQIAQSAAIRIGQARGYRLEEIDHLPPETIARAGEGDAAALKAYEERRLSRVGRGSPDQRPSMGQDMAKGRRTEIEYLNDFVREGRRADRHPSPRQ